ncbi:MAG: magnesium transporter, partial [Hyphomicrobium sp.]
MVDNRDIKAGLDDSGEFASRIAGSVADALASSAPAAAADLVRDLKAPDLAEVIEQLAPDERLALIQALGTSFDYEVLSELDETVRDQLSEALPNELLARAVTELDTDDAAYVIESLEE